MSVTCQCCDATKAETFARLVASGAPWTLTSLGFDVTFDGVKVWYCPDHVAELLADAAPPADVFPQASVTRGPQPLRSYLPVRARPIGVRRADRRRRGRWC